MTGTVASLKVSRLGREHLGFGGFRPPLSFRGVRPRRCVNSAVDVRFDQYPAMPLRALTPAEHRERKRLHAENLADLKAGKFKDAAESVDALCRDGTPRNRDPRRSHSRGC